MGRKFVQGLGNFSTPNGPTGQVSSAPGVDVPSLGQASIVVDMTKQSSLHGKTPLPLSTNQPLSPIPVSMPSGPKNIGPINPNDLGNNFIVVPTNNPTVFSDKSATAPYETLFHDFDLDAYSFYNFWKPDELTNDSDSVGNRKLSDVPRFVKITWNRAPTLPDPNAFATPKIQSVKNGMVPVKFSAQTENPKAYQVHGISFTPDHLQPPNFSQIKNSVANGYLAPGVIEARVDLPLSNAGADFSTHSRIESSQHIDEDAFLMSRDTEGLSIHELQAQVHQLTNGTVGAEDLAGADVSQTAAATREEFLNGSFIYAQSQEPGGYVQLHGVDPSSPALSLVVRASIPGSEPKQSDQAIDLANSVSQPAPAIDIQQVASIKVKFVDPALGGAVSENKVNLMTRPEHAESLIAVAHSLPNLEILSQADVKSLPRNLNAVPFFPSPPGVKALEYVGYVLEKYSRDSSGNFKKEEEIDLPSVDYDEYIDAKVKYGVVYRYRIRSIIRWTHKPNVTVTGPDPLTILQNGSAAQKLASLQSTYLASEWSGYANALIIDNQPPSPPDELTVRPDSAKKRIIVTMKMPPNPQRDIYKTRIFRKLQDLSGNDLTDWIQLPKYGTQDPIDFGPQNVIYYDSDVDYKQLNRVRYVYTAQSVSRHEEESSFSDQLGVTLNQKFAIFGEDPVLFVSGPGVKMHHFGAFSTYPFRRSMTEFILTQATPEPGQQEDPTVTFSLAGREVTGNKHMNPSKYLVRVSSLDTGETRDVSVIVSYNDQPDVINTIPMAAYVPTDSVAAKKASAVPSWLTPPETSQVGETASDLGSGKRLPRGTRG